MATGSYPLAPVFVGLATGWGAVYANVNAITAVRTDTLTVGGSYLCLTDGQQIPIPRPPDIVMADLAEALDLEFVGPPPAGHDQPVPGRLRVRPGRGRNGPLQ